MEFLESLYSLAGLTLVAVFLVCAIGILVVLMKRQRASIQHLVLVTVITTVLLSPFVAICLSLNGMCLIRVPVMTGMRTADVKSTTAADLLSGEVGENSLIDVGSESSASGNSKAKSSRPLADKSVTREQNDNRVPQSVVEDNLVSTSLGKGITESTTQRKMNWPAFLIGIWFSVTAVLLIRLLRRILKTRQMLATAVPVANERLAKLFRFATEKLELKNEPGFFATSEVKTPIAAGILKPAVFVPSHLTQQLTDEETIDVLSHELAHVLRRDALTLFLQALATCLFWPIPLLHVCNRYLNSVREDVCDNFVLATRDPVAYAETLLKIASLPKSGQSNHFAVGIASAKGSLESRIARIVKEDRDCSTSAPLWLGPASLIALLTICSLACGISFADLSQDDDRDLRVVQGQVLGVNGNPASGCSVTYTHYTKRYKMIAVSDRKGQFEFQIPEEKYGGHLIAVDSKGSLTGLTSLNNRMPTPAPGKLKIELEECLTTSVEVRHKGEPVSDAIVLGDHYWQTETDTNGKATLRVPFSDPVDSIWVFHKTKGVAFWYPTIKTSSIESAREKQPKQITLDLLPTRTCTVEVTTEDGEPLSDFEIFPYFRIEGDSNRKFFPLLPESFAKTDEAGVAKFKWIPNEPTNWFIPTIVDQNYRKFETGPSGSTTEELRSNDQKLVVKKLDMKVDVVGKVVKPGGAEKTSLKGIIIQGSAYGGPTGFQKFTSFTNAQGEFKAEVLPGLKYHVVAMGNKWSSDVVAATLADKSGNSNAPIELNLYPSTLVTVNVIQGKTRKPVLGGDVLIEQNVHVEKANVSLRRYLRVDSNGQAKFGVGKGKWTFTSRNGKAQKQIYAEIKSQDPLTYDAHYDWAGEQKISGKVVDENNRGIENAAITVIDYQYRSHKFESKSGAKGEWEILTDVRPNFAVLAFDQDKKLGGLKLVHGPSETPCTIKLAPLKMVRGQLRDLGAKPLEKEGVELLLIHEVKTKVDGILPGAVAKPRMEVKKIVCARAITDAKGKFEFQAMTGVDLQLAFKVDAMNIAKLSEEVKNLEPGAATELNLKINPAELIGDR